MSGWSSRNTSANAVSAGSPTTSDAFSDFDYAGGTRYPERATASVGPSTYLPGATVAYVPITLDRPTPNTVIARVMTEDGTGLVKGVAGGHYCRNFLFGVFLARGSPS